MRAGLGGVVRVGGGCVGIVFLLVFGGGRQVTGCGGFLRFAFDGGLLFGFGGGAAFFSAQLRFVGALVRGRLVVGVLFFFRRGIGVFFIAGLLFEYEASADCSGG